MKNQIELMAPAGSWESLRAAIQAKADSVYFGIDKMNMRARAANNFQIKDIKKIMKILHENNMKGYLTLNIVVYDDELKEAKKVLKEAKLAKVDAIIASDLAIITEAKKQSLNVHLSTQANISNTEAIKFYSNYADTIVLARELTLKQIKKINDEIKKQKITGPNKKLIKTEAFIHGALCIAISGKCYMSLATYGHSANRGDCLQTCRRKYKVLDEETGQKLRLENEYVMSPSDLCTITILKRIIETGISIMKIEGRGRSPEYVYEVTKTYREALELIKQNKYTEETAQKLKKNLEKVFNRGFWEGGYYLGTKINEWSNTYGSKATQTKQLVGKIINYYEKKEVASILVESTPFKKKDQILIIGPTTGIVNFVCDEIQQENQTIEKANKNELVSIKVPCKIRKNDKVYVIKKKNIY
ncbi:U32 family peptidase [Candidatus Woesearchaeota archaeon]|nr:U32 family peptidase [Candidatus Woesearchaeota archaeon]